MKEMTRRQMLWTTAGALAAGAIEELLRDRRVMNPVAANLVFYRETLV